MVYERGQLVALAVGGGGAVVAAVVLAYLIKKYRESTRTKDDENDEVSAGENTAVAGEKLSTSTDDAEADDVPLVSPENSLSAESTPSESAWTADIDIRLSSFELERPLDLTRFSQSSGIVEVESPSFDELIAIETEIVGDEADESGVFSLSETCSGRLIDDDRSAPEVFLPVLASDQRLPRDPSGQITNADGIDDAPVTANESSQRKGATAFDNAAFLKEEDRVKSRDLVPANLPAVVADTFRPSTTTTSTSSSVSPIEFPSAPRVSSSSSSRAGSATLDDIEEQTTVLSPSESRALVAFLGSPNPAVVRRALLITVNAATFPANRYFLRRAGCVSALIRFLDLDTNDADVVETSEKALGNLAVDETNHEYMRNCLAPLFDNVENGSESVRSEALICLTNLSKTTLLHEQFSPYVDRLMTVVDAAKSELDSRLHPLKILIHLSVNATLALEILSSRCLSGLNKWLALTPTGKPHIDAAQLQFALHVCDFLSNLLEAIFGLHTEASFWTSSSSSKDEWVDRMLEREETLLGSLASEVKAVTLRSLLFDLNRHPQPEVRFQGKRLYALLAPLWRKCKAGANKAIVEEES